MSQIAVQQHVSLLLTLALDSLEGDQEMALIEDLSQNYNQYARPALREAEPLEVQFGIALQQIINLVRVLAACSGKSACSMSSVSKRTGPVLPFPLTPPCVQ